MKTRVSWTLLLVAVVACNAESPAELASINPAALHGRFLIVFSGTTCALQELEMSFTQFSDGGALPAKIRLVGSWQFSGENHTGELVGELIRDTGEVFLELIDEVRWIDGIFLDNDNLVAGYTDIGAGCTARVSGRRIR